jgi:FtsP/CotA-like multicopper oxidase with cupredoxin domain
MWTYNGMFPGPTIRRPTGQTTQVTFTNNLPVAAGEMTVHNHGNHSTSENDGQPDNFLIAPGASRTYTYTHTEAGGNERGATQWYHDHRMDVTGRNVWMGLAGFYIIDDPADPSTLPAGEFDVPLLVADREFDRDNQIPYSFRASGVTGDHILVNGVAQPFFEVGDRKYRFRILNGSNIRDYEFTLDNGDAFIQIGTESGLLPAPVSRASFRIGPAERLDLVIDFAGRLGQTIHLRDTRSNEDILQFRVTRDLTETSSIPATLRAVPDIGEPTVTRIFEFDHSAGQFTINGLPFDPNRVDAFPALGTTEKWVLRNGGGWLHIAHIHDVDQQCLTRNGGPCPPYETMKETWFLDGGETVEVKLKFTDNTGRYPFHCHVLEHEDDSMMTQFEVVSVPPIIKTGFRNPTAEAADTGGDGNGFELNPANAFTDGAGFASNIDGAGDQHRYYVYGFDGAIPAGATILGIEAQLDWWLDGTGGANSMSVELSWDGGATWTAAKTDTRETKTEHTVVLGSDSDTWGRTWTPGELSDANFRVRVRSNSTSENRDFFLDWVPVQVSYR